MLAVAGLMFSNAYANFYTDDFSCLAAAASPFCNYLCNGGGASNSCDTLINDTSITYGEFCKAFGLLVTDVFSTDIDEFENS